MDLAGTWRAAQVDEAVRRSFVTAEADDSHWEEVPVPGHWQATPAFAGSTGPVLHRRRFSAETPAAGERAWLVFDGICTQGDVWLDGTYLGDTDGWFRRHTFEVTEGLRARDEHVLAVEVTSGRDPLLGTLAARFPDQDPGGIWGPVRLERTGPVRVRDLRVLCREATDELAVVILRAELDSDQARVVTLRTSVAGVERLDERRVAKGSNFVDWSVGVDRPERWWPAALGPQVLHDLGVEVVVDGTTSHVLHRRVGLRSVARRDRVLRVNGERLFLKGSALEPPSARLGEVADDEWRDRVVGARDRGLDLLRVHGFVAPAALYDAADELGVLLWQDLPLVGAADRRLRRQAERQATAMVDLIGHHPSIALWCGHDEPEGGERLDRAIRAALVAADPSRPVIARATTPGWVAKGRDPGAVARVLPRLVRFASNLPPDGPGVETLRRLKYRPVGGFCLAAADDAAAADEAATEAALAACAPVLVVADRLPGVVSPADRFAIDVHVVNDRRVALHDAVMVGRLGWNGGGREWQWCGEVGPDDVVRVATIPVVVPDAPGPLTLELTLTCGDTVTSSRYRSIVG